MLRNIPLPGHARVGRATVASQIMVHPRTYTYIQAKRLCESLTGLARNLIESPSMNKEQSSHRLTADDVYEEVANAVVTYMVECGLKDIDVIAGEFFSALAHAYKPLPRFWCVFRRT